MAVICPTVLASEPHAFREQMERIAPFAERIQIDLTDGMFAPGPTVSPDQVWWPHSLQADIHLMYQQPLRVLDQLLALDPHMIIVHAEADGDFDQVADKLVSAGVKVGVALLPSTPADKISAAVDRVDHVLVFAGQLGSFGGHPDVASFRRKIEHIRSLLPHTEIGWDGGIDDTNAFELAAMGVQVLNVGGYIQRSENPAAAYATLKALAEKH